MAVGKGQIQELYELLRQHIGDRQQVWRFLRDCQGCEAYRRNKSFRDSVHRLLEYGSIRQDRRGKA